LYVPTCSAQCFTQAIEYHSGSRFLHLNTLPQRTESLFFADEHFGLHTCPRSSHTPNIDRPSRQQANRPVATDISRDRYVFGQPETHPLLANFLLSFPPDVESRHVSKIRDLSWNSVLLLCYSRVVCRRRLCCFRDPAAVLRTSLNTT
jgi:hypothetical protein